MNTSVSQRLSSAIEDARLPNSDGGRKLTPSETDAIVADLLTNGVAAAGASAAIAAVPGLNASERAALLASVGRLTQVRTHAAVFAGCGQVTLTPTQGGKPVVQPIDLVQRIPTLVQKALRELDAGNVAAAARTLAPLVDGNGEGWTVRSGGAWLGGRGTDLSAVLATAGVPAPQATRIANLVKQTQVWADMKSAMNRAPALPPTAQDLRDYGAALARQKPRLGADAIAGAFTRYAEAFHRHPGHVDYPAPLTAASALPPQRPVGADGLSTNSCVGYALMAHEFLAAAGFKCQFVYIESSKPSLPGHAMVYATRGNEAIVTSNHERWVGTPATREQLVEEALVRTAGELRNNHLPATLVRTLPL